MSSTDKKREVRTPSPFADEVAEEGALAIDEGVLQRSVSLDPPDVLGFGVAEREGVACVRRDLKRLSSGVICGTEPVLDADDDGKDSLVDVVGSGQRRGCRV